MDTATGGQAEDKLSLSEAVWSVGLDEVFFRGCGRTVRPMSSFASLFELPRKPLPQGALGPGGLGMWIFGEKKRLDCECERR